MKRAFEVIKTAFVWIIVALSALLLVFTLFFTKTNEHAGRSLFGYQGLIVLTDSMRASNIDAGDVILIKEVDPATLQPGDIISFITQDPDIFGETVTHMIRETTSVNGHPAFITYGTTTGSNDQYVVTYPDIVGKHQLTIPHAGTFFQYLKTPAGYISFILIPFALMIIFQIINLALTLRRHKANQLAEIEEERRKVEEERAENQKMMQELMALKAQLGSNAAQTASAPPPETELPRHQAV